MKWRRRGCKYGARKQQIEQKFCHAFSLPEEALDFLPDLANFRRTADGDSPYQDWNSRLNADGLENPASRQASSTGEPCWRIARARASRSPVKWSAAFAGTPA